MRFCCFFVVFVVFVAGFVVFYCWFCFCCFYFCCCSCCCCCCCLKEVSEVSISPWDCESDRKLETLTYWRTSWTVQKSLNSEVRGHSQASQRGICGGQSSTEKGFWSALGKLRKAAISFVVSVCPSARSNFAATGQIFMTFNVWGFLFLLEMC